MKNGIGKIVKEVKDLDVTDTKMDTIKTLVEVLKLGHKVNKNNNSYIQGKGLSFKARIYVIDALAYYLGLQTTISTDDTYEEDYDEVKQTVMQFNIDENEDRFSETYFG